MKINIIRAVLIIMLLTTFSIIFGFSSQNAEESSSISRKITLIVTENSKTIKQKTSLEKQQILSKIETIIRKIAHFSIYTIVGILLMTLVSTYKIKNKKQICISLIIGIIYATSDEIHQMFTPGRGPQITDVMIDSMGVLLGILLVMLLLKIYGKLKEVTKVNI